MKKDCIDDFTNSWKQYDRTYWDGAGINWDSRFGDAGYYSVPLGAQALQHHWADVHEWCREQFGTRHYTWAGSRFWFETPEAAAWFALRWQ
jgi:hypothetical protein